jgi:hypothetical protein
MDQVGYCCTYISHIDEVADGGIADNFISACASCHSTAQKNRGSSMVPSSSMTDEERQKWQVNPSITLTTNLDD